MNDTTQQFYYGKIKDKDSVENDVDNFWLNLLPDYFQKKLKYGIEQEARPLPEVTKQRADWTIRYIKNGDPKKVILIEGNRKGMESQPAQYMKLVRTERNQDPKRTLYGAVNIGTYTRFYQLDPYEQECIDYPGTNGKCYELAGNEAEIHAILLNLVQKTSHGENTNGAKIYWKNGKHWYIDSANQWVEYTGA
ncbi:uncharacterized protein BDR25DRAFT_325101 [Lindgomyces ingoldianus]|uniref:Uncharacterized protein n=1 Tax=Lindgomyces ingoldianus TaxID=673940 RepID=A0ACB6QWN7_9PLEO|nr:uncharacterized protein BDR25DRAFT_325101 [Lindgomyces ingoldianus]KAF2471331.1 hypothetical protein BDR25DRAFT_325101 [Lindgomyces ingoldianus]